MTAPDSTPTEREAGDVGEVAAVLERERERAARAEAERDHWKAHAEEAGEGFSRVCKDYARVAARNSDLVRRLEVAEAKVARVEVLADEGDRSGRHINGYGYVLLRDLRAALNGDQP